MQIRFNKNDFNRLKKVAIINKNFSHIKGYKNKITKQKVNQFQKPVWEKMKQMKNAISEEIYFHKHFDITESRRNKQSTVTTKGPIRQYIWTSLVPWYELAKKKMRILVISIYLNFRFLYTQINL
jgi:hypothetical protein